MIRSIPFTFAFSPPPPPRRIGSRAGTRNPWPSPFFLTPSGRQGLQTFDPPMGEGVVVGTRVLASGKGLRSFTDRYSPGLRSERRWRGELSNPPATLYAFKVNLGIQSRNTLHTISFFSFLSWNNSMRCHEMYRIIVIKELKIIFGKLYSMIIRRGFFLKKLLLSSKKGIFKEFFFGKIIIKL